jgi:hypothetical protein
MMTVALDVPERRADARAQLAAVSEDGEVLLELQAETQPQELRRVVSGIRGRKRVVFEQGPLSGLIRPEQPGVSGDALAGIADEIIAADPGASGAGLPSGALTRPAREERAHREGRGLDGREGYAAQGRRSRATGRSIRCTCRRSRALQRPTLVRRSRAGPYRTFRSVVRYDHAMSRACLSTDRRSPRRRAA